MITPGDTVLAYRVLHLKSLAELRLHAGAWDCLWQRSAVTIPTVQAALLEHWLVHFENAGNFEAIVVERDGRWAAALPLVRRRLRGVLSAATMPSNHWTPAGDLLVDPAADAEVYDLLAHALAGGPWTLLWLDFAIVDSSRWKNLIAGCERVGLTADVHSHFRLPRVDIVGTWDGYRDHWSRNHRQNLARARRKLIAEHGPLVLRELHPHGEQAIANVVAQGFAIEDRSWKGAAGSSVVRSPEMLAFFTRQAQLLARNGQLEMTRLEAGGSPIAFMYGWKAKGVFHAFKSGYDEAYAIYSPGQLLIHEMLQAYFCSGSHQVFDCVGPVTSATARWQTSDYQAGRIVIAPPRVLGQAAYFAYKHLAPTLRRWRQAVRTKTVGALIENSQNIALAENQ